MRFKVQPDHPQFLKNRSYDVLKYYGKKYIVNTIRSLSTPELFQSRATEVIISQIWQQEQSYDLIKCKVESNLE